MSDAPRYDLQKGDHTRAAKAGNSLSQLAAAQLSLLTSPNSATAPPRAQAKPSLNKATASVLKAGILVGVHMRLGQGHAAELRTMRRVLRHSPEAQPASAEVRRFFG